MFGESNLFRATSKCGIHAVEQHPDDYFYNWEYDKITCKKCLSLHLKEQQYKRNRFIENRERNIREERGHLAYLKRMLKNEVKKLEKSVPKEIAKAKAEIKLVKARMDSYKWDDDSTMYGEKS
jgi:hypothetical protein